MTLDRDTRSTEVPRLWGLVLALASLVIVWRFLGWVILAVWLAGYASRLHRRLAGRLGRKFGAAVTVIILTSLLLPALALIASLVIDAVSLVQDLVSSGQAQSVLERLVSSSGAGAATTPEGGHPGILGLLFSQADRAWAIAQTVAGATAYLLVGLVILIAGLYSILVEGEGWWAWVEDHAPVQPTVIDRFADAFMETGRGLAFGVFGAGAIQAVLATGAYMVLGVPQALALGMLTLLFSIVPAIGTAAVWVPVAAGLALTGRPVAALGLALFGTLVIGTVDNVARPWLSRRGKLQLPTYVVLVSMFGGVAMLGAWGLVYGPLVVRLAREALEARRDALEQGTEIITDAHEASS